MFDNGFFGGVFDFDGDGELDAIERAADLAAFAYLMEEIDDNVDEDDE